MQIRSVGIDLGKTTFHPGGAWRKRQGAPEEVHPEAADHLHSEPTDRIDRFVGMFRSALSRARYAN